MINIEIENIEKSLNFILRELGSLNNENFDQKTGILKDKIDEFNKMWNLLKKKHSIEDLAPYKEKIAILTKQIKKIFDNMISEKYLESKVLLQEIENLKNKKKLQNYRR